MNKKWKIVIYTSSILLIGIVCACFFIKKNKKDTITYTTATISTQNLNNIVTATGTVEPITQVEVGTQVSGIIDKIYVDYNSVVKKGDLLAEIDKVQLTNELEARKSELSTAKTEFEYQEWTYNRTKGLHDKQLVSDSEYEVAFYNYSKAKNSYDKSKIELAKAQRNLSYCMIYSPIDGIVLSRAVDEGQTVASSFSTPTLFTIAKDLKEMRVVANVDEADIGEVKEGQRVTFSVDAYPNNTFEGSIKQVRLEATTTSNVVTYEVIIDAPNPDEKLKPGLTANITIYTMEKNNVIAVPIKALKFAPTEEMITSGDFTMPAPPTHHHKFEEIDSMPMPPIQQNENRKVVWKKNENNKYTAAMIEVGIYANNYAEILSGLNEGDEVITDSSIGTAEIPEMPMGGNNGASPFMPKRPGSKKR